MADGVVAVLMAVEIPHLQWPVVMVGTTLAIVEQDSLVDVSQCVEVIASTSAGTFIETPDVGWEDPTFSERGPDPKRLLAAIVEQEPRAAVVVEQTQTPGELQDGQGRLSLSVTLSEEDHIG